MIFLKYEYVYNEFKYYSNCNLFFNTLKTEFVLSNV
jgi:hypothetical protein